MRSWWFWLLMWMSVTISALAVAGTLDLNAPSQFKEDVVKGLIRVQLEQRLGNTTDLDCQVEWVHRDQFARLQNRISRDQLSWVLAGITQSSLLGRSVLSVAIFDGDRRIGTEPLGVLVAAQVPVVVASHRLERGRLLLSSDVLLKKMDVTRVPAQALRRIPDDEGVLVRMPINDGGIMMPWMIGLPATIRQNDPVSIVLHGPSFLLKVAGVALQDGAINDWIHVRNMHSQKVLLARVLEQGAVSVQSGEI